MKRQFVQISVLESPCPVYVEKDVQSQFEDLILDVEKIGMYSHLTLSS